MPQTQLTWYGQSAFKITTPAGNMLLVDPWLTNPVFEKGKDEVAALKRCDLILVTHDIPITSETRLRSQNERERNWWRRMIFQQP